MNLLLPRSVPSVLIVGDGGDAENGGGDAENEGGDAENEVGEAWERAAYYRS